MGSDDAIKTVCLGDEYDSRLRDSLLNVLKTMGGTSSSTSYGVGGSQEIETLEVMIDGEKVVVEAETYIGLMVTGRAELVDRIAELVSARSRPS